MSESTTPIRSFDVAIVGGGFAGSAAAGALAARGMSVCMIDLHDTPRPAFRAEKLSLDQLPLLDAVGLLEPFKAVSSVATRAINVRGDRIVDRPPVEDHGLMYVDMVRLLRDHLPPSIDFLHGKVGRIDLHAAGSTVQLDDGRRVEARLVVLATGHVRGLRESLGIQRRVVHPTPTINVAFTLRAPAGGFAFPSLAAYGETTGDGVDYTSIFPVGDAMRVNVFVFGSMSEPRITAFKADPMGALLALQPGLTRWLAGCEAVDRAEFFAVEISICDNVVQPGLVLIGDAYRTSCPAVGNGLSCLLVDVARLAHLAPGWMATPGIGVDKIGAFYRDPIKHHSDQQTHQLAIQRRKAVMSRELSNRVRRAVHFARRRLASQLAG